MAPKVKVPMDFGRHLLGSPTHNNLTLNTKEGGIVRASSVILSFNSQVIDHMTSTLHMTSVDMLEFSEAAVQVFVDAAYSGTVEGLTKEVFRDVNKIANVFDVSWLVGKCSEFFTEVVNSVKTPSYTELLYLFEEASFVYENLKRKEYIKVTIKKIETLRWKKEFIEKYLENVEGVSTGKLDMVIELAGSEVNCVVETLTKQLTELIKIPDSQLPLSCKYLLDNLDLFLLKESNTQLFDRLFSVLGGLSDEHLRWTFNLIQRSSKPSLPVISDSSELQISDITASSSTQHSYEVISNQDSSSNPTSTLPLTTTSETRCDVIPNMRHELDLNLTIHGLLDFLFVSKEVTSLILALEALWVWNCCGRSENSTMYSVLVNAKINDIVKKRSWSLVPPNFGEELRLDFIKSSPFLLSENHTLDDYFIVKGKQNFSKPIQQLLVDSKLKFCFAHPSVKSCNLPGSCGFILKTVKRDGVLRKLQLCTEERDYRNEDVHFHEEIRAEKMHVYISWYDYSYPRIIPLSWLSSILQLDDKRFKKFCDSASSSSSNFYFMVMYEI